MRYMNKHRLAEIAGWYGMVAILLAYCLVSFKLIAANGYVYQLLNLSGAIGIILVSIEKRLKQTIVLNTVWLAIAFFALVKLLISN